MTSSINIYAGQTALKKIQSEGFQQQHFNVMAGASGGPKWFTFMQAIRRKRHSNYVNNFICRGMK